MPEETTNKKTGMTPTIDPEDLVGSRVYGVIECKTIMVKFRNGRDGKDEVRIAVLVPGGELYLFPIRAFEESQKWLRDAIIKKLDKSVGSQMIDLSDHSPQV